MCNSARLINNLFLLLIVSWITAAYRDIGDCNWHGNSNAAGDSDIIGVALVHLRCSHGYIDWQNPKGGAQIEFKQPLDLIGFEFTVQLLSQFPGVNLFKDNGEKGLDLLRSSTESNPRSPFFIQSTNGSAILYLDVSSNNLDQIRIHYDLKETPEVINECNLCSSKTILELFCNADFTVKAKVENKYFHDDENKVMLDLLVYHVFHQSSEIFLRTQQGRHHIGFVTMHGKCSPKTGKGHYILMGNVRKDIGPFVDCYMQFKMWREIEKRLNCAR